MKLSLLKFTIFKTYKKDHNLLFEFLDNARGWYILHNHNTKDYFPEGTGLLNLSVSTLNE